MRVATLAGYAKAPPASRVTRTRRPPYAGARPFRPGRARAVSHREKRGAAGGRRPAAVSLSSVPGHECQRPAPACWPATLLRGGVLRVTTRPPAVRRVASADQQVTAPAVLALVLQDRRSTPEMSLATLDPPAAAHARPRRLPARDRLRRRPTACAPCRCTRPGRHAARASVSENLGVPTLHRTVVDYANLDHAASHPGAGVGQGGRRRRPAHLLLGPPRQRLRLQGHLALVRGGPRRGRARFVGAREDDLVVFTRNTTDSLNLLGRSLPRDTTTFVFETEHHAALLPWNPRRTVRLPVPGSVEDALSSCCDDALAAAPAGPPAGRRRRRLQRHRRAVAGRAGRRPRPAARRPRGPGRRAARPAPRRRHRRARRRLRRLLRPQALRPVRRRACSPGAPTGSTRRVAVPARRRRHRGR